MSRTTLPRRPSAPPPRARSAGPSRLPCLLAIAALAAALHIAPAAAGAPAEELPRLGSITIEGNTKTDTAVILRELGWRVGDPFDEDALDDVWDHLEDVGYFAFVDMEYEENDEGTVDLLILVDEDETTRVTPWIRYDRRHKYLLGGVLSDENLRGKGERLDLRAAGLYIRRARLTWERPWLLNRRGLSLTLDGGWERAGFVFRPTDHVAWDAGLNLRQDLPRSFYLATGLGYAGFRQRDGFLETRTAVPDPDDPLNLDTWLPAEWRERLVLGLELGWDSRDMPYYPTRGGWHRVLLRRHEQRSGSWLSYGEVVVDLRQFLPLPWGDHLLALHAWGRRVSEHVPLEDRLYWGGPESLRGYPYARLEGEEGYLFSAEYRWPLFLMPITARGDVIGIGLHFFTDLGDAWYDGYDEGRPARWSWGGGAHLNVWNLQFRFEYARTRDGDDAFQFADTFNF